MNEQCIATSVLELPQALDDMRSVVDRMEHEVGMLRERLTSVMSPAAVRPQEVKATVNPDQYSAPLACAFDSLRIRIRDCANILDEIRNHLQV